MEKTKVFLTMVFFFSFFFLFLKAAIVFASVGVSISPATGTHTFTLDGGTLEFTVFNTGSEEAEYTLELGGTAADFADFQPKYATIKSNAYSTFEVLIDPTVDVKTNQKYELTVTAKIFSNDPLTVGSMGRIDLYFEEERTKPYAEKEIKTGQSIIIQPIKPLSTESKSQPLVDLGGPEQGVQPLAVGAIGFLILLLFLVLFYVKIRNR